MKIIDRLKSIFEAFIQTRKVKKCCKILTSRIKDLPTKNDGIDIVNLSVKFSYINIVDAMTLIANATPNAILVFPNHEIRTIYLSKYEGLAARTTVVDLLGTSDDKLFLVPPMASEVVDAFMYKLVRDVTVNDNQYLITC